MRMPILIIAAAVLAVVLSPLSRSDTVILKDGEKVKGLIIDEFKDRIVVSTVEGEKTFMKGRIRSAVYDSEVKALMQKARNQFKKEHYVEAYYTYKKAFEMDPDNEEARERLHYMRSYLETKTRADVIAGVDKKRHMFQCAEGETPEKLVRKDLGITLVPGDRYVVVEEVNGGPSSGADALKEGDRIVSVWGELMAHMDVDEVASALLMPGEIRLEVERSVTARLSSDRSVLNGLLASRYKKAIGAALRMLKKGLTVVSVVPGGPFDEAGIEKGDLLWRINGRNLRYVPMAKVIKMILRDRGREMELAIRRDITIWRKDSK